MSEVFVQVLYDFKYCTEQGNEIKIKAGEELLLLKKSNKNWWHVIRNCDEIPFYAPSNYLTIIGFNCNDDIESIDVNSNITDSDFHQLNISKNSKNPKFSHLFRNEIEQNISNNSTLSEEKSPEEKYAFKNPLYTEDFNILYCEKDANNDVPYFNELNFDQFKNAFPKSYDKSSNQDSMSPVYVNIPVMCKSPPIPQSSDIPIRKLSNNWFEYIDEDSARKYYFHSTSGKVTWKPPGRHENMQSTPESSEPNSPIFVNVSNVPEPPPKQLKPKLKKLTHSSNESLESSSSLCMFTILPPGWSQESDSITGTTFYYNEIDKKKWFSSLDENGRTYFYDEDSAESVWELPNLSSSYDFEEFSNSYTNQADVIDSTDAISCNDVSTKEFNDPSISPQFRHKTSKFTVQRQYKTRSLVVPECVNLGSGEENKGFLPASFGEGYWPSVQDGHFSITHKGTLNKTKLIEGGRRIRKNWTSSFVVLTDVVLLFFKDIRSAHLDSPGIKPELLIDLNGALVEWCPEKSSRKNVFQISTVFGQQLLLQDDNTQTTKEWFDTIQAAIMKLPSSLEQSQNQDGTLTTKDIKLSRSKSTKYYPSYKNNPVQNDVTIPAEKKKKIRDKLRHFFIRRPTLESLREKGIIIDELVFGCHLENLCLRENRKIPKFVSKCITAIEKKELTADGLYRASGNLSQVQKIRIQVNQDDYTCLDAEEDVHVLTGALKMFFREMKEPLFPFNMFDKFLEAITLLDFSSKLEALRKLVQNMPGPNYETLRELLQHLLRVTKYHKQNRMQIQNLAIVFGPTLLCSEQTSSNIALDMMHQNRIVEFLLLEFSAIFNEVTSSK